MRPQEKVGHPKCRPYPQNHLLQVGPAHLYLEQLQLLGLVPGSASPLAGAS